MDDNRFTNLDPLLTKDISFLVSNDTYMVARSDTLTFLKRLSEKKCKILGLEGFWYGIDGSLTPDMSSILDLGSGQFTNEEIIEAVTLIVEDSDVNFFEFVVE